MSFRAAARGNGFVRLQGSLRPDPAPLGVFGALRGTGPTLAEEALGRISFRAAARGIGFVRLQGSLRPDPAAAGVSPEEDPL
jgi:hypothetical protein